MQKRIIGVVGSYRKGGSVDVLVDEALRGAQEAGAAVEKIYLIDRDIKYCTNCRKCTQDPGEAPGKCIHDDEMRAILDKCLDADGLVLGSPVNFFNVTAVTRCFMERLVCLAYWPWHSHSGPVMRNKKITKKAVLITAAGMPTFLIPLFTDALKALRQFAKALGAKPVAKIYVGLAGDSPTPALSAKILHRARSAGKNLV
jgi:multimeric flavodoxin WrbA